MRLTTWVFCVCSFAACTPPLDIRASRITDERVIAVVATPPEAAPGASVTLHAIVASPSGPVDEMQISYDFCMLPRAPDESTTVSAACLGSGTLADGGTVVVPIEMGMSLAMASIPSNACMVVGPQTPPAAMGIRQRPPDPDITGGYQLPIRITLQTDDEVAFARERIRCNLPDAPAAVARAYQAMYHNNQNPTVTETDATLGAARALLMDVGSGPMAISNAGATIALSVHWPPASIETYVLVDPSTRVLAARTEQLEVAWYTNGGTFTYDRTAPDATGLATANTLVVDASRMDPVNVWVVLTDDRGGTDAHVYAIALQ